MTLDEFQQQIRAICDQHDVREFCLYGRMPEMVGPTGHIQPPDRLVWVEGEAQVAEEAAYHFGRIAEGKEP